MGKKINDKFLKVYTELDMACCEKFGVTTGGIGEYINRLNNARYAPDREDVLPRLVKYRNLHKRFTYEPSAMRKDCDVTNEDIKWIEKFTKSIKRRRDPIAMYLKKAQQYASKRRFTTVLLVLLGVAAVAAIGVAIAIAAGII